MLPFGEGAKSSLRESKCVYCIPINDDCLWFYFRLYFPLVDMQTHLTSFKSCKFNLKWSVPTGKCVDASPLVVKRCNKTAVYIGSHSGKFIAVDVASGAILWQKNLDGRVESSACASICGTYITVGKDWSASFIRCLLCCTCLICIL